MGRMAAGSVEGEFPGGPEVRTLCFQYRAVGSIPGTGYQILEAVRASQKKKKKVVVLFFDVLILDTTYCLPVLTF